MRLSLRSLSAMIGSTISHYEILEMLGEGGMGIVYKARDLNLDRLVALKILKTGAVESPEEIRQFELEAKTISALNHPHIATIHDRGEHHGKHYLVFEFLSGGTLKEKLVQRTAEGRPFSIDEVVRYAAEAGRGLAHAHNQNVIHRDVKTDNLMLTEQGAVKVTDFGLAHWNTSVTTSKGQSAAGTAAYMSPEQAQGLTVDERSDVFSFGLVLYELLTSETAFQGLYAAAVIYDVVNTPTPPVKEKRPDAPDALCRIVRRATAKSPDDRYSSMDELLSDLAEFSGSGDIPLTIALPANVSSTPASTRTPASASRRRVIFLGAAAAALLLAVFVVPWPIREPGPGRIAAQPGENAPISIAVLPLENLSGDPAKDFLADGMTEALITDLAKSTRLSVISRTSVMRYKDAPKSLPEIAAELNVQRIVEGTVLQVGDEVRITAQLIDADKDQHLWAESYRSSMSDVLGLQQEISRAIAAEIDTRLAAANPRRTVTQIDPKAYEAYLRARQQAFQWNLQSVQKSIVEFKRAIEIDPDYGEAHAGLAMAYGFLSMNGGATANESWSLARASAERALQIDNTLDSAHSALGFVQAMYDWNWTGAEASFLRALELNPGAVDARHAYGMTLLTPLGRFDEALEMILEAQRLDPLSAAGNTSLGDLYYFQREYAKAIAQYNKTIELDSRFPKTFISLGFTQLAAGNRAAAVEAFEQAVALSGGNLMTSLLPPALTGGKETVLAQLGGVEDAGDQQYLFATQIAMLYAILGEPDAALGWLERAYLHRASSITFINISPVFDEMRDDPRFISLIKKMNLQ